MTPLAELITQRILRSGPISIAEYMETCLLHPRYGYYATRDPFGAAGDFTTSPEIHQLFGELCGLALAQAWIDQGRPSPMTLAEPGPGRGTLMADMLRAIRVAPGMVEAAQVTMIEASAHLRRLQRAKVRIAHHIDTVDQLPERPLFLVANEFLDALPIRQYQRLQNGWAERVVGLSADRLQVGLGQRVELTRHAQPGDVVEQCPAAAAIVECIARTIAVHGGAAILVDYGGWNGIGDTFQALRNHQPEDPLANPGEADLTAHVDFAPLAAAVIRGGAMPSRPIHQGDWLLSLGAAERAGKLEAAGDLAAMSALRRLTHAEEMGHLFKAMAIWPKGARPVPGFAALRPYADNA